MRKLEHQASKINKFLEIIEYKSIISATRNRLFASDPFLIAFIAIISILLFLIIKMIICYRKRNALNIHMMEYMNFVHDLKEPMESINEPLNLMSANPGLDDSTRDSLRIAIWQVSTIRKSIHKMAELEKDPAWIKNLKNIRRANHNKNLNSIKVTDNALNNYRSGFENLGTNSKSFIEKVFSIIRENYENPDFSVDLLSQKIGMSRSSFYKRIKAISGEAPADLIRLYRLERAKELLKQRQYSISEIAFKTGFSDVKYFRDVFRKIYKCSPSQFIKSE